MNKIDIEGVIGWDVTARGVKRALANFDQREDVSVTINSPGGYVDDGFGIYTALKNHPGTVNIHITGLAASMGSVIAMAGDSISMEETGLAMIHPPASVCWGTAVDMRKEADVLDKYETRLVKAYERRDLNLTPEELSNAIAETTWYTAEEFLNGGFIDSVTDGEPDANRAQNHAAVEWLRVAQYKNIPKAAAQFFKTNGAPQLIQPTGNFQDATQGSIDMTEEEKQKLIKDTQASVSARWDACIAVGASPELTKKIASNMAFDDKAAVDMLTDLKAQTTAAAPAPQDPPPADPPAPKAEGNNSAVLELLGKLQTAMSADVNGVPNNPEDRREAEAGKANAAANAQAKEAEAFKTRMANMAARTGYRNPAAAKGESA
jgi:ATP-dependent protease ClpP protease subunit